VREPVETESARASREIAHLTALIFLQRSKYASGSVEEIHRAGGQVRGYALGDGNGTATSDYAAAPVRPSRRASWWVRFQQELEAAATFLFRWLVPNLPANVDQVVVPHSSAREQREIS
jgi:hypothetical protein